jgi:hypothetical protein
MTDRPSLRHGLPFGWWKNPDVWGGIIVAVMFAATVILFAVVVAAWFFDLKPPEQSTPTPAPAPAWTEPYGGCDEASLYPESVGYAECLAHGRL